MARVASPAEGGRRDLRERGARRRRVAPAGSAASRPPAARVRAQARRPPRHLAAASPPRRAPAPSAALPASRAAAPPGTPRRAPRAAPRQVLGNFHGGPGPLPCAGLLRLGRRGPRSPPLPAKKRTRSHQLICGAPQPSAAPRTSQANARGLVEIKVSPASPTRKTASFDPFRSATLGWSARPSPALVPWGWRQAIKIPAPAYIYP